MRSPVRPVVLVCLGLWVVAAGVGACAQHDCRQGPRGEQIQELCQMLDEKRTILPDYVAESSKPPPPCLEAAAAQCSDAPVRFAATLGCVRAAEPSSLGYCSVLIE